MEFKAYLNIIWKGGIIDEKACFYLCDHFIHLFFSINRPNMHKLQPLIILMSNTEILQMAQK